MADRDELLAALDREVESGAVSLVDYWRRRASIESGDGDPRRPALPTTAEIGPAPSEAPAAQEWVPTPPVVERESPAPPPREPSPVPPAVPPAVTPAVTPQVILAGTPEAAPEVIPAVALPIVHRAGEIAWRELGDALHGIPDERSERRTPALADGEVAPAPGLVPIRPATAPDLPQVSPAPDDAGLGPSAISLGQQPGGHQPFAPLEGAVQLPVHPSWNPQEPPSPPRGLARLSAKDDSSVRKGSRRRRGGWRPRRG